MEFADIALAKFLETAPELGPLIINFTEATEDIEDATNGTKVGLFSLRAGAGLVTVPVISKGDTIFPIDSVFVESEGLFRPLSKTTIQYISSMSALSPGRAIKKPKSVNGNPDVQSLISPPRTGKFVYASASRLSEFLAVLPNPVKNFVFEKIAGEKSLYAGLDKMFGLKAIFAVLNGPCQPAGPEHERKDLAASVITTPSEISTLGTEAAQEFLQKGYVVARAPSAYRTAVAYESANNMGTYSEVTPVSGGGRDYNIAIKSGGTKAAFIPNSHRLNPVSGNMLVTVFEDGNFVRGPVISVGDAVAETKVMEDLFAVNPPRLLRELERGEQFLMFTNSGEVLGPFSANSVSRTLAGVEVTISGASKVNKVLGYTNFTQEVDQIGENLIVPHNIIVLSLGHDISDQVERSINRAQDMKQLTTLQYLGAELDVRYDGIEFSAGKEPLGKFASAIKYLVEKENIEPGAAESFLKQAEQTSHVKIFLSKTASTVSGDLIPSEGTPARELPDVGLNGSFVPALQSSMGMNDAQTVESTIISQLLQVPELFEYISEYLPELESAVDRLGRILFLTRVKIDKLSTSLDSDSVFSMISQIKTVYRQLGDTTLKLKGITTSSLGFNEEEHVGKTNGS